MQRIESEIRQKLLISSGFFTLTLIAGTIGYWIIGEGRYSIIDCLYMTVITVATVGYREVIDITESTSGKFFTIGLIFAGMSVILYFFSNITAFLIEGDLKEIFRRKKMEKLIEKMKDHYIVCGAGKLGRHIIDELCQTKRQVVVIELDPNITERLSEEFPQIGIIQADATETDTLLEAGIERAKGIIVATGQDKDNLVIILSARQISPSIRIVARCNEIKNTEKLRRAGADSVVSSNLIGGLRMASEMVRPKVVTFLDQMLRDRERNLRIEEITIPEGSPLIGKSIGSLREKALILAVIKKDGSYEYNPNDRYRLEPGITLIFMASPESRISLENL